jgi:hypothetical protein
MPVDARSSGKLVAEWWQILATADPPQSHAPPCDVGNPLGNVGLQGGSLRSSQEEGTGTEGPRTSRQRVSYGILPVRSPSGKVLTLRRGLPEHLLLGNIRIPSLVAIPLLRTGQ